jgi:hypothetical protein
VDHAPRTTSGRASVLPVATLSLGAAAIHFAVIPEHVKEGWLFVVLFAAIGWFQALWPVAYALRLSGGFVGLAVLANAGTVVVWIASRSVGVPIGSDPWVPEAVGAPDVVATLFEIGLVLALLASLRAPARGRVAGWLPGGNLSLPIIGFVAVVVASTTWVLTTALD